MKVHPNSGNTPSPVGRACCKLGVLSKHASRVSGLWGPEFHAADLELIRRDFEIYASLGDIYGNPIAVTDQRQWASYGRLGWSPPARIFRRRAGV